MVWVPWSHDVFFLWKLAKFSFVTKILNTVSIMHIVQSCSCYWFWYVIDVLLFRYYVAYSCYAGSVMFVRWLYASLWYDLQSVSWAWLLCRIRCYRTIAACVSIIACICDVTFRRRNDVKKWMWCEVFGFFLCCISECIIPNCFSKVYRCVPLRRCYRRIVVVFLRRRLS